MPGVLPYWSMFAAGALLLVGCDARRAPDPLGDGDGRVEWQGALSCADCDAIETRLLLVRDAGDAHYDLSEHFVDGAGGEVFEEDGRWSMQDGRLDLEGTQGARRHFALLADGSLRPSDAGGEPAPSETGVLMPVAADAF